VVGAGCLEEGVGTGNDSGTNANRDAGLMLCPLLVPLILPKFYYKKRRFSVTSKCWQMHGVQNIDEIKN
jgi:hypothetical protein